MRGRRIRRPICLRETRHPDKSPTFYTNFTSKKQQTRRRPEPGGPKHCPVRVTICPCVRKGAEPEDFLCFWNWPQLLKRQSTSPRLIPLKNTAQFLEHIAQPFGLGGAQSRLG